MSIIVKFYLVIYLISYFLSYYHLRKMAKEGLDFKPLNPEVVIHVLSLIPIYNTGFVLWII